MGGATPAQVSQMHQIRQYLDSLPQLAIIRPESQPLERPPQLPASLEAAGYTATGSRIKEAITHNKLYLFQPMSSAVWPGALLQGKSVAGGAFSMIPLPRGPGRIRLSGGFTSGNLARDLPVTVDGDRVRIDLLRSTGATDIATSSHFELVSARDFSEAAVKLGISYDGASMSASLRGAIRVETDQVMVVGRYTQVFYTASFEPLALPGSTDTRPHLFAPNVTLEDVKTYAQPGNPPLYVSEVAYGRIALVTFAAKGSVTEVEAAVKAAYSKVKGQLDVNTKNILNSMTISVIQIGNTGANMVNPVTVQDTETLRQALARFIDQGVRFNVQSNPGLPIQMTLKYVGSGAADQVAAITMTTEYLDVVSIQRPPRQCVTHLVWDGPGGGWQRVRMNGRDLEANPGDRFDFNYRGGWNWSGVVASGDYDAEGWHTWDRPRDSELGFPITNKSPFGLIGRFGSGSKAGEDPAFPPSKAPGAQACRPQIEGAPNCSSAFWIGRSRQVTAGESVNVGWGPLWLGTNDNNPYNGDANKRWTIEICVERKDYGGTSTRSARPFNL